MNLQKWQGAENLMLLKLCFICMILLLAFGCQAESIPPDTIVEVHGSSEGGRLTAEIHNVTSSIITDMHNYLRIYTVGSSSPLLDIKMLGKKEISADGVACYEYDLIGEDHLEEYINNSNRYRFVFRVTGKYRSSPFVVETPSIKLLNKESILKANSENNCKTENSG